MDLFPTFPYQSKVKSKLVLHLQKPTNFTQCHNTSGSKYNPGISLPPPCSTVCAIFLGAQTSCCQICILSVCIFFVVYMLHQQAIPSMIGVLKEDAGQHSRSHTVHPACTEGQTPLPCQSLPRLKYDFKFSSTAEIKHLFLPTLTISP